MTATGAASAPELPQLRLTLDGDSGGRSSQRPGPRPAEGAVPTVVSVLFARMKGDSQIFVGLRHGLTSHLVPVYVREQRLIGSALVAEELTARAVSERATTRATLTVAMNQLLTTDAGHQELLDALTLWDRDTTHYGMSGTVDGRRAAAAVAAVRQQLPAHLLGALLEAAAAWPGTGEDLCRSFIAAAHTHATPVGA